MGSELGVWTIEDLPVEVRGRVVIDKSGCWLWMGGVSTFGHGRMKLGGKMISPHRYVAFHLGILADPTKWVLHSCDIPGCVNPSHLRQGDRSENMRDCYERGRLPGPDLMRARSDWVKLDGPTLAAQAAKYSLRALGRMYEMQARTIKKALDAYLDSLTRKETA